MSIYDKLGEYLKESNKDIVRLNFEDIEKIIDKKLNNSLKNNTASWYGYTGPHVWKLVWLNSGYYVDNVDLVKQVVVYKKLGNYNPKENKKVNKVEEIRYRKESIIPVPNSGEVEKYLAKWDSLENYVLQEKSLDKLFFKMCPKNDNLEDILIKCSTLNDFYSTNIFSIYPVAKHILNLNIDERLKNKDESLVNDIALVEINGKSKYFYSFATKYCSHHDPFNYPIYDDYVKKVLLYFKKIDKFYNFNENDLKSYSRFKQILINFKKFYNIDEYNLKDIDRYLWQLGKDYFPKKY